jgi:hypothetical protein
MQQSALGGLHLGDLAVAVGIPEALRPFGNLQSAHGNVFASPSATLLREGSVVHSESTWPPASFRTGPSFV